LNQPSTTYQIVMFTVTTPDRVSVGSAQGAVIKWRLRRDCLLPPGDCLAAYCLLALHTESRWSDSNRRLRVPETRGMATSLHPEFARPRRFPSVLRTRARARPRNPVKPFSRTCTSTRMIVENCLAPCSTPEGIRTPACGLKARYPATRRSGHVGVQPSGCRLKPELRRQAKSLYSNSGPGGARTLVSWSSARRYTFSATSPKRGDHAMAWVSQLEGRTPASTKKPGAACDTGLRSTSGIRSRSQAQRSGALICLGIGNYASAHRFARETGLQNRHSRYPCEQASCHCHLPAGPHAVFST
jgi:hypothetical protein